MCGFHIDYKGLLTFTENLICIICILMDNFCACYINLCVCNDLFLENAKEKRERKKEYSEIKEKTFSLGKPIEVVHFHVKALKDLLFVSNQVTQYFYC